MDPDRIIRIVVVHGHGADHTEELIADIGTLRRLAATVIGKSQLNTSQRAERIFLVDQNIDPLDLTREYRGAGIGRGNFGADLLILIITSAGGRDPDHDQQEQERGSTCKEDQINGQWAAAKLLIDAGFEAVNGILLVGGDEIVRFGLSGFLIGIAIHWQDSQPEWRPSLSPMGEERR